MGKDAKLSNRVNYQQVSIFGTETPKASQYVLSEPALKKRRVYGNLELIEIKPADSNQQVLHINDSSDINYLVYSQAMRFVRHEFSRQNCRENLWKRAVNNLYKRINFLQLNIEFLQEDITADEFERTLNECENEYVISLEDVKNTLEAEAINDIVRALGRSFDVHEVAELFGIEPESFCRVHLKDFSSKKSKKTAYLTSGL